jgi:ligand-binding SRPBCC domain-containing protein
VRGPYAYWRHRHEFLPQAGGVRVRDQLEYTLPFGFLGSIAGLLVMRPLLGHLFNYRQKMAREILG